MQVLGVIFILGGILVVALILVAGRRKPALVDPEPVIVPPTLSDPPAAEPVPSEPRVRRIARTGAPRQRRRKQPE
jgi:hypothetical protein